MDSQLTSQLLNEPVVGPNRILSPRWYIYFRDNQDQVNANPTQVIPPVVLEAQDTSIGTTAFPAGSLNAGLYRITVYARITTAAGASSDLDVTIGWTDGGVSCSKSASDVSPDWPINGNTTATTGSQTFMVNLSDGATPITYSTTRNSNPGGEMEYLLKMTLESLGGA